MSTTIISEKIAENPKAVPETTTSNDVSELEEELKLKEIQNQAAQFLKQKPKRPNPYYGQTTLTNVGVAPSTMTPKEREEADSRSVYVGNVDYDATAKEIEEHFMGCGAVARVSIICDKFRGTPKGFAYVEFIDKEGMNNSLAMTDSLFRGRQIKVTPKRTNKPGISTTDRPIRRHFALGAPVVVKYVHVGGYRPQGRTFRGRPAYKPY